MNTLAPAEQRREDARLASGRFGEYALDEVDMDLPPQAHWVDEATTHHLSMSWSDAIRLAVQTYTLKRVLKETERRRARQAADPDGSAAEEQQRRWYSRVLDLMTRYTAPDGHFNLKRTLRNAAYKGGVVMAAILSFAIPAEYAGEHGLGVRDDATQIAPLWQREYPTIALEHGCSDTGLPDDVEAVHALVLDKTAEPEPELRLVPFEKGWKIYQSGREDMTLVAVCSK